jgi:hypothetical protein
MVSVPVCLAVDVGVKVTLIVQLVPTTKELPQLLVAANGPVVCMLLMVTGPPPVLLRLTVFAALVVPTFCLPKLRLVVDRLTVSVAPPMPDRESVCEPALSKTVIVPVRVPVAVGAKSTVIAQLPPAGIELPTPGQVPEPAKAKSPVMVNAPVIVRALPVLLVSVEVSMALVVPTFVLRKVKGFGEMLTEPVEGLVPVPVRLTVCGLPAALSATEIEAVRVPEAAGVNVTLMVQLAPATIELPQLLL